MGSAILAALAGGIGGYQDEEARRLKAAQEKAALDRLTAQTQIAGFREGFRPADLQSEAEKAATANTGALAAMVRNPGANVGPAASTVGALRGAIDIGGTPFARTAEPDAVEVANVSAGSRLFNRKPAIDPEKNRATYNAIQPFAGALGLPAGPYDPTVDYETYKQLAGSKAGRDAATINADEGRAQRTTNQGLTREFQLRDEYSKRKEISDATEVGLHYQRVKAGAQNPSAAGDLALIYGYMKLLDPGSTVREGEFATAQNAGGAFDRMGALYNRVLSGERLTEARRADFLAQATNQMKATAQKVAVVRARFNALARTYGIDPKVITFDPFEGSDATAPSTTTPPKTAANPYR